MCKFEYRFSSIDYLYCYIFLWEYQHNTLKFKIVNYFLSNYSKAQINIKKEEIREIFLIVHWFYKELKLPLVLTIEKIETIIYVKNLLFNI